MIEKVTTHHSNNSSSPPGYHSVIETQPPPPTYIQSTVRLCYNNQPYISDMDQYIYRQQQEQQQINRSSYKRTTKWVNHISSWATALYNRKRVFFTLFIVISIIFLGLVISFITLPSLIKHSTQK